jgi:hypothetical protein
MEVTVGDRKISIKHNGHVISIIWYGQYGGYFVVCIDDVNIPMYGSGKIYKRIITPLVNMLANGAINDDILDCLRLIKSAYRDVRTYTKYVEALADIGTNIKKWIRRRAGAYLRHRADFIYKDGSKKLLAFLCRNGWIVVDVSYEYVYACIRKDGQYSLVKFDYEPIILADMLLELKRDMTFIERIRDKLKDKFYDCDDRWLIKQIVERIPREWWRPLDIEALILEHQLRQLA